MSRKLAWADEAGDDYVYPQQKDQGSFKRWSLLIKRGIVG
jgi:hypothetical protein